MKQSNKLTLSIGILFLITACNSSISNKPTTTHTTAKSTIIDGLTYENKPFIKEYNWDDANKYCQDKGWRLPTRKELAKVANIPLYNVNTKSKEEFRFKEYDKWFSKNKSKRNSNLFIKKIFVKNMMNKGYYFWTSEEDTSMPKEHYYHHFILFDKGYIGTSEGHLTYSVLCVK